MDPFGDPGLGARERARISAALDADPALGEELARLASELSPSLRRALARGFVAGLRHDRRRPAAAVTAAIQEVARVALAEARGREPPA